MISSSILCTKKFNFIHPGSNYIYCNWIAKKRKERELIEFCRNPSSENYRPKGGLFEYYGRKTKDGAVMSPTLGAGTRVSISSARARPMAHQRYPCEGKKGKKPAGRSLLRGWFTRITWQKRKGDEKRISHVSSNNPKCLDFPHGKCIFS